MAHAGWTEAQLEAMTASDRREIFDDGFVYDLRDVPPELAQQALDRIRASLGKA